VQIEKRKEPRESNSSVRIPDLVKRFLMVLAVTNDKDTIDRDLMTVGILFGEYEIAVREMFMPVDSFSWTQALENKVIAVHEKHAPMTRDRCRKLIRPERSPGGFGEFLKASKPTAISYTRACFQSKGKLNGRASTVFN
jgi:hypothetical protein